MKEALIICPKTDNEGNSTADVFAAAVQELILSFDGVTVSDAEGHWRNSAGRTYHERVWQLHVACDETAPWTNSELRDVASHILHDAKQQSVYLRLPSGDVEFISAQIAAIAA